MSDCFVEMQVFRRVAERASFSRAVEDLELSRAAVSEIVQNLERRLGARLLIRSTRRVRLSQEGEHFIGSCQEILEALQEAEQRVSSVHATLRGRLRTP